MLKLDPCIQPPVESFVEQGAAFYCEMITSLAAEVVTVTYRILNLDGTIRAATESGPQNASSFDILTDIPESYLLSCSISCSSATNRAETYAVVKLRSKDGRFLKTFVGGYVTTNKALSYPPFSIEDAFSGQGKLVAPGFSWGFPTGGGGHETAYVETPANRTYRMKALTLRIYTLAVAGNRYLYLAAYKRYDPTTITVLYKSESNVAVPASQRADFIYSHGESLYQNTVDAFYGQGMPELILNAGDGVYATIAGFKAGDYIDDFTGVIEEFLRP